MHTESAALRVVVTGATGALGPAVVRGLAADPRVGTVVGLSRHPRDPGDDPAPGRVRFARADVTAEPDLAGLFAGADAVVHLASLSPPARDPAATWRTNVIGSDRVFEAAAAAGVPALVHASSVMAYAPGPKDRAVDERWPTHGWPAAAYPREKAYAERLLDAFERRHPEVRVARVRPAIALHGAGAHGQRRRFAGPLAPRRLPPGPLRVLPDVPGLRFQTVHTDDAADAFRRAALDQGARGAFNVAADPPVDAALLAELTGARRVRVPARAARAALAAAFALRLVPTSAHTLDSVRTLPLMDTARARRVLGWAPRHSARAAVAALVEELGEELGAHDGGGRP
ncbi:NAD-dependent epimerase/dehydratase family protein [Streptomyces radicis]|uniref:NAD-dependent epimerase/dehydratase family protein n=1 Tax=Streptomyces radicis TaxID=1750517 RepID=A0A3A9VZV9_9ACTN|nr:NAD-dependent epimerase/dehydratase family protein [Streptomyces radicis]RKN17572.1 NAD-dependent epimerase/dehydratase family protein [Streptomyces radicis]